MLSAVLPHSRRGRILAAGALLDALATGLYLAVATLYFVQHVRLPATSVGWALSAANIAGLLVPMPVARLTRRLGLARVYLALLVLRGLGMAGYALVDDYVSYLAVTVFFTACSRAALPLLQVLVGQLEGEQDRTRTMASLRTINNIGLSAGLALAAGVQLLQSPTAYRSLFAGGGLAFCVVAVITAAATREVLGRPAPEPARRSRTVYRDRRFLTISIANAVLLLHDSMLFILIPLWVIQRSGLPESVSSILLLSNTAITVVLQVRVAKYAKGFTGAMRLLRWSVVALAAAGILLASAGGRGTPWVLVILLASAVALLTVGENLHAVAGWELSFLMSDPDRRVQYLSLFSLGYSVQLIIGPTLMTSVVLPWGLPGVLLMVVLFAAAAAVTAVAVRGHLADPRRSPVPAQEASA